MISSRSALPVCSCTSVGRLSPTKTHSMPPTPPENSPSPLSCAFRSGSLFVFWGFFFLVFFCAFRVSGSTTAQLRSLKRRTLQTRSCSGIGREACLIISKGHLIESSLFSVPLMEAELETPLSSLNKRGQISFNQHFQQMVETQLHKLMLTVLTVAPVIPLSSDHVDRSVLFSDISGNVLLRMIENAAVPVKLLA